MVCIKLNIPKELSNINDKLKAIYHSKNKGMIKIEQETI